MTEIYRLIRHGFAPLVAWAVAKGWLPEYAQADVLEFIVLALGFGVPYLFSLWRDQK